MALGDVIGRLSVTLGLDTASFETGARRAAKSTRDTGDNMEALGAKVGTATRALVGLGVAIAGSQLVGMLKDLTMEGLKYASSLGEQAQQLGVLSSELQEYRYAASQAGLESAEMDQALAQLTKRIGIAATGAGAPARAFQELGISVRGAKGEILTAGEAIPLIADALAKIPDPAERARLLTELFGKSGQKLEPLMSEGAAGVNKLRAAAHELGIVLSDEAIANADETADKIDAMNQVLKAQIATFVAENAKEILALAQALLELAGAAMKALNAWMDYRKALGARDDWISKANAIIDARTDKTPAQKAAAKRLVPGIIDQRLNAGDRSIGPSWLGVRVGKPQFGSGGGLAINGTRLSSLGFGDVDRSAMLRPENPEQFGEGVAKILATMGKLSNGTIRTRSEIETANVRIAKSFKDMADDTLNALDRMASAVKGGGFLDILGAVIGLGLQLGSIGLFGKGVAANINRTGGIPGYAGGTSFHPGGLAMVGERGPELVNLPRGSQVIPNHALRGGGGTRVEVVPSPYFDVRVQENIGQAAPAIAMAGARGGEARVFARQARRVG